MLLLVLLLLLAAEAESFDFDPQSLNGTEAAPDGLTTKQLAILRAVRHWTTDLWATADPWAGWAGQEANCDNNDCLRYQISSLAYAVALAATRLPAYQETFADILLNCVHRMLDIRAWQYVGSFPDFVRQPTFPDPVAHKNIMYSGHLAQMLLLYEWVTGDDQFERVGWDFVWNASVRVPYTRSRLLAQIWRQTGAYGGAKARGGVPCEPDSVFVICNNFAQIALQLSDTVAGSNLSSNASAAWMDTLLAHGQRASPAPPGSSFFNLDFLLTPGLWEPVSSEGADAWALAWLPGWWPPAAPALPQRAFAHMAASSRWYAWNMSSCPRSSGVAELLRVDSLGSRLFPFNDNITSSLFPLISRQLGETPADAARELNVLRAFECLAGTAFATSDALPAPNAYFYKLAASPTFDMFATANLLAGMVLERGSSLRQLLATPLHANFSQWPRLASVPFPAVAVSSAMFQPANGTLSFRLLPGDAPPPSGPFTAVVNATQPLLAVTVNGAPHADTRSNGPGSWLIAGLVLETSSGLSVVASFSTRHNSNDGWRGVEGQRLSKM